MKVEKLRRKKWFDRNLKNKDLKEGDLCLMYSVRNTKRKLKYQGMGPYQVVEITPQGAVRIATLDGVVMEGYINGSKLKRFYGPLTLHALQTLHGNQRRKREEKLAQQRAREEAKEREIKEMSQTTTLSEGTFQGQDLGDDEPHIAPARIPLMLKITEEATFGLESLIDPGASHNYISFEAWQTLPKGSMVPTNATITAINGTRTRPIGYVTLDVMIAKHVLQVRFYVMPAGTMEEHVILGRTWCYLTNCQIDWHKKHAKMVYKGNAAQEDTIAITTRGHINTTNSANKWCFYQ